jgi:DNA-binding SARP family transcriptional activator
MKPTWEEREIGERSCHEIGVEMVEHDQTIRVLGPIDVMTPAGCVGVGGPHARALLGALVIGAGHAVPMDELDEAIWCGHPPDSVANTLQSYVSHLRQILGADTILRTDHSYELNVDLESIDALEFESLLNRADRMRHEPETCRSLCRDALNLWRGRPFGDLADDDAFRLETHRLEELRLAAMELSFDADLALGHHNLIVGELEAAVEEYPYRERLWYLLIEALATGNRRVEALRECGRLRRVLGEVGVSAGDKLAELEQQILA